MARKPDRQPKKKQLSTRHERKSRSFGIEFGEPEQVLSGSLLDSLGNILHPYNGYYEPPISRAGLSRMRHANAHHGSCLIFRRNMLCNFFVENPYLSISDFKAAVLDYLVFGEAHFLPHYNFFGEVTRLSHLPTLNMRRMPDTEAGLEQYLMLEPVGVSRTVFEPGTVIRAAEYDTGQQIYGVPDWRNQYWFAWRLQKCRCFGLRRLLSNPCFPTYRQ
ncbi:hypothetical protein [Endozoicomonas sp. SESOKO4]|uniref:hypothetical protein n=1 Tax=Endozoicomonas sp. SESOKO4 TaxID=2828745 RepID=UPI002147296D|nr:hypothetical protein [Endozoicomonas sp. SESOKO4]